MKLGAYLAHLGSGSPYGVASWARRLVDAGFESLWMPQIIGRSGFVPDPFVALAAAASAVDGVELGAATVQVPLHHPADLAHKIQSLQLVCGDRLTLGLSPGSTQTDYALLDRDFGARFRTFDENVVRLRDLLAEGRDDLAPGAGVPPLLLGSWGKNVEKAARHFDGWLASAYRRTPDQIVEALGRFRAAGGGRAVVCAIPPRRPGRARPGRRAAPLLRRGGLRRRDRGDRTRRPGSREGGSAPAVTCHGGLRFLSWAMANIRRAATSPAR
ncbi:LLM class flavin-dependent oxidoreductase [Pseudonocardia kujensis]|uniref:LLM class flavin-dependent oxidoreductase n=1 Tax=Pseudonocardia kujensis TaxID=1128675 RepID=UPI001E4B8403|nr:LLM class flavin-dependent oxidoreductase [Pseudonocardia kujensis]MCE0767959.1 LLM class flavin-dependent oxidoreductase [Pseudonocardia kujensis]